MIVATTAATKLALIEVEAARAALSITDQESDAALAAYIARASDVIARHCRRVFALETVAETFRLDRCQSELILARYPVAAIVSIAEGDATLDAADYELDAAGGTITRLHADRPAYWSTRKIVVTYQTGYDLPAAAPEALQQACVQLVKSYYLGSDRDPMVRSEGVDAISSSSYFAEEHLPPDVRGLLRQFRNIRAR